MIYNPLVERTNCHVVLKPPVHTLHLGMNRMEALGIATPHVHTPQGVHSAFWLEISQIG